MPEGVGKIFLDLLIVFIFILINAFFAGTEMAIITLNDAKMNKMAEEGHKGAKKVIKFINNPGTFLATIQVGVTLAGFLSSAFAANNFSALLTSALDPAGKHSWISPISTVVITIILSYFSLVLGELVPKRVAQKNPEKWAFLAAGIVKGFGFIATPFVKFLTFSTNMILKLLGINPEDKDKEVTEEEIRMLVDVANESDTIEDSEKEMIENIFEFNDKDVSEIMTHRKKIVSLSIDAPYEDVIFLARNEKFTRIPVYRGTIDDVVGILHIKDLLGLSEQEIKSFKLSKYIREPLFVHETKKISSLFNEMKSCGIQLAVILDEYGGTMGIVTIEDMVEEIVGNIFDEFDDEDQECIKLSNGDLIVAGDMTLSDLENVIDVELTDDEYDTIAGLVIQLLDRVPEKYEKPTVKYKNLDIKVLQVQERWISKVLIHINPVEKASDEDDESSEKEDSKKDE